MLKINTDSLKIKIPFGNLLMMIVFLYAAFGWMGNLYNTWQAVGYFIVAALYLADFFVQMSNSYSNPVKMWRVVEGQLAEKEEVWFAGGINDTEDKVYHEITTGARRLPYHYTGVEPRLLTGVNGIMRWCAVGIKKF